MLRYFYLIYLLVCIRFTFCYEYISDRNGYNPRRVAKDSRHRKVKENGRRFIKRQDYEMVEDKDPVARIDVASFIEKADYDAVENSPYISPYKKRERVSKEYSDYGPLSGLNMEGEMRNQDYLSNQGLYQGLNNVNEGSNMFKNMLSPRQSSFDGIEKKNEKHDEFSDKSYQNEFFIDKPRYHKPVKKCPLKQMKIPFFSRKKNGTTKGKKVKKRKYFFFNSSNKTKEAETSLPPALDPNLLLNKNSLKIGKRSYNERICPVCRRKFPTETEDSIDRTRRSSSSIIHNSRQFYQPLDPLFKNKPKKDTPLEDVNYPVDEDNYSEERRKRDNEFDRERQLKELEEVERKIDGVEINAVTNARGSPPNTDSNIS